VVRQEIDVAVLGAAPDGDRVEGKKSMVDDSFFIDT
jgi:hypothetical protein